MKLFEFKGYPIGELLKFEEDLLRHHTGSFCLINEGTPPAIVMGISGKEEDFVSCSKLQKAPIPVIKRFSGGGTVIVDENTLFITFIFPKEAHTFEPYPEPILRWAESFYQQAFPLPAFALKENDFVLGEKKCGGNAQYIRKQNWLLHTSFLWDYTEDNMDYLLFPKKTPSYRQGRSHTEFLCRLKDFVPTKKVLIEGVKRALQRDYSLS